MGGFHDSTGTYRNTETKRFELPLASFVDDSGAPIGDFTSEANPTMGFDLTDSEAFGIRWNNHATPGAIMTSFTAPTDRKPGTDLTLKLLCSKTGATGADATTFTIAAFNNVAGALHDADADFGGATDAIVGNATAKTVQQVERALASANLVDGANVTMTLKPTDGLLGTDDIVLLRVQVEYEATVSGL